jgi:RimJ/RimL family protein N-acetyltransferase
LRLFMAYLHRELGVGRFTAKIGDANAASIALFTRALGFRELKRVPVGGAGDGRGDCHRTCGAAAEQPQTLLPG